MKTDVRWLQRLDNLEKALGNLEEALIRTSYAPLIKILVQTMSRLADDRP